MYKRQVRKTRTVTQGDSVRPVVVLTVAQMNNRVRVGSLVIRVNARNQTSVVLQQTVLALEFVRIICAQIDARPTRIVTEPGHAMRQVASALSLLAVIKTVIAILVESVRLVPAKMVACSSCAPTISPAKIIAVLRPHLVWMIQGA